MRRVLRKVKSHPIAQHTHAIIIIVIFVLGDVLKNILDFVRAISSKFREKEIYEYNNTEVPCDRSNKRRRVLR